MSIPGVFHFQELMPTVQHKCPVAVLRRLQLAVGHLLHLGRTLPLLPWPQTLCRRYFHHYILCDMLPYHAWILQHLL